MQTSAQAWSRCLQLSTRQNARASSHARHISHKRPIPPPAREGLRISKFVAQDDGLPAEAAERTHHSLKIRKIRLPETPTAIHASVKIGKEGGLEDRSAIGLGEIFESGRQTTTYKQGHTEETVDRAESRPRGVSLNSNIFKELFPDEPKAQQRKEPKAEHQVPRMSLDFETSTPNLDPDGLDTGEAGTADRDVQEEGAFDLAVQYEQERELEKESYEIDGAELLDSNLTEAEMENLGEIDGQLKSTATTGSTEAESGQGAEKDLGLLILRGSSKLLTENDFRCLTPYGKHIEGWSNKGHILKIVRGRDEMTLARNGNYYIVFESNSSAQAYLDRVLTIHSTAQVVYRDSLASPLAPARSQEFEPSHPGRMLDSYVLAPPIGKLRLTLKEQPWPPLVRSVVERSGYEALVRGKQSEHEVLLWVDGALLQAQTMRKCIVRDGQRRRIYWATSGKPWAVRSFKLKPTPAKGSDQSDQDKIDGEEVLQDKIGNEREHEYLHRRFVVSFVSHAEAQRFVMSWHRRDIKDLIDGFTGEKAVASAELTW